MMKWLVVVYYGDSILETELPSRGTITVGAGPEDTILLKETGVEPGHLTLQAIGDQVQFKARSPVSVGGVERTAHTFAAGDVLRIISHVSLAIFGDRGDKPRPLSLQGQNELSIGRSSRKDLCLEGVQISSNHAMLHRRENEWELVDEGSRNGTFLNGKRVPRAILREGDVFFIGGWKLRYQGRKIYFENSPGALVLSPRLYSVGDGMEYPFFQRSPRLRPTAETLELELPAPPGVAVKPTISWLSVLLPPLLTVSVMMIVALATGNVSTLFYTVPMSAASMFIAVVNYNMQTKNWQTSTEQAREKYTAYLKECEAEVIAAEGNYLHVLNAVDPGVEACVDIAAKRARRLWERSSMDDDFLALRLGTGTIPSNASIKLPRGQMELDENPLLREARLLKERHIVLHGAPISVSLAGSPVLGLAGKKSDIQCAARSLLLRLATHHSYDDVRVVLVYPEKEKEQWSWARWLPHLWDDSHKIRYIASTPAEARSLLHKLEEELKVRQRGGEDEKRTTPETPHYVLLLADKVLVESARVAFLQNNRIAGMTIVYAYGDIGQLPGECRTIVTCEGSTWTIRHKDPGVSRVDFTLDETSVEQMDAFARSLAPVRLSGVVSRAAMPKKVPLLEGLGVGKVEELDVLGQWNRNLPFKGIVAPIGIRENGEVFSFDIHEKGMGPHGIVAGTTRSGKSETLTTWLLSMAARYHPQEVSYVLIDFKGDGLSGILMDLPHVAGRVTNVEDITSIERNLRSLQGELLRRQRVFMETRQENIHRYQEAYRSHRVQEPMPYLIIVIDEFAELKTQFPDQMNGFMSIARVGGSLGVYMVLATQSPGGGIVNGQVLANSRFRICLRTAEAAESKDILGTTDAFQIKDSGRAYVKVGNNVVYEQIQTFYSKDPYRPGIVEGAGGKIFIVATDGNRIRPEVYDKTVGAHDVEISEGTALARYIQTTVVRADIPTARQVWTSPLPEKLTLRDLLPSTEIFDGEERRGWFAAHEGFTIPVGMVDDPENQCQYPLVLDFVKDGHQVLYGAPQSGKTEFLRTVLVSSALRYRPDQVRFMMLDFGAWGLKQFEKMPHTLLVTEGGDAAKVQKAADLMLFELESRKRRFAQQGVGTLEAYQDVTGERLSYLLILIDNMASLYSAYPDLMDTLATVAREGGGLGIYLLMTAGSQGGFMYRIAQYIKRSFALQLTDKSEYRQLFGGSTKAEPGRFPGRGFIKGPLEFQTALCVDGAREGERVQQLRALCEAMAKAWGGKRADAVHPLAEEIPLEALLADRNRVQIGLDKRDGKPFDFVFTEMNGCVICGPSGSGKTNALCCLLRGLALDEDASVYLYEKGTRLSAMYPGAKRTRDGAAFDAFMREVLNVYLERSKASAVGGEDPWPRIVLCIDDFLAFYDEISDETADMIPLLLREGKRYGILVFIAGDKDGLSRFFNLSVSALTSCLAHGNGLVLGGRLREYALFNALHEEADAPIGKHEGYLIHNGEACLLKLAHAKEASSHA